MKRGLGKLILTALLFSLAWINAAAQPGDPKDGGKPGVAPISGIEILIGLGGLLGAKRIFDSRKKK